jgi:hypothetical protein
MLERERRLWVGGLIRLGLAENAGSLSDEGCIIDDDVVVVVVCFDDKILDYYRLRCIQKQFLKWDGPC